MDKIEYNSKNTKIEYLKSYDKLKNSVKTHQRNSDISNLVCCDVKEYNEEYGKELALIIKARERLEDFIDKLDHEI
ncbi:MAG: hypothetical protein ACREAR_02665 [Nitrosotalea sp.]